MKTRIAENEVLRREEWTQLLRPSSSVTLFSTLFAANPITRRSNSTKIREFTKKFNNLWLDSLIQLLNCISKKKKFFNGISILFNSD